jgi:monoterpene epsilon-lactone hydrolase
MAAKDSATGGREPCRYEFRVRGPIGPTMMQAFPTLAASRRAQETLLIGSLPDVSALYGVIDQLEALGLQLLEIRRLPNGDPEEAANRPNDARPSSPGHDEAG